MQVDELREALSAVIVDLQKGDIGTKTAMEITNAAGKIISSAKAECEYMKITKSQRKIAFFENSEEKS